MFIGLCPHGEIEQFEELFSAIEFIDPRRNTRSHATKFIDPRQRCDLKTSVV